MKRIYLSLLIVLGCAPIFSQTTSLREGWKGSVGGGVGVGNSMAFVVDGEFGKHITPKFYVGGGIAANYNEAGALGLYVSPRYYYSKKLNSFYVESSLGLTLFGLGKFFNHYYGYYDYEKFAGPTTGISVGYVFDEKLSLEFGVNCFASRGYDEYADGSIDKDTDRYQGHYNCLLKVNYTFNLGSSLSEVKSKLKR